MDTEHYVNFDSNHTGISEGHFVWREILSISIC